MNVSALIGGVVLAALLFGAGFWTGDHVATGTCAENAAKAQQEFQKQIDARDADATRAAEVNARRLADLEAKLRANNAEVIRYVQTPAAHVACLDAAGVGLWNRDASASAAQVRPGGAEPRP